MVKCAQLYRKVLVARTVAIEAPLYNSVHISEDIGSTVDRHINETLCIAGWCLVPKKVPDPTREVPDP